MTKAADLSKTGSLVNSSGQIDLTTGVTGVLPVANGGTGSSGGVSPGGSTTQVQYNNAGAFGGNSGFVYTGGNVGIGTSSPSTKLHVSGTTRLDGNVESNAAQYIYSWAGGSTGSVRSGLYLDGTNQVLQFFTATNERFRIGSSGQLGIGGANYGTSGQVLVSQGSGSAPVWGSGGKVLQVVSNTITDQEAYSLNNTFQQSTIFNTSITPSSASSKVLITISVMFGDSGSNAYAGFRLTKNGSEITAARGVTNGSRKLLTGAAGSNSNGSDSWIQNITIQYLDSPATTSSITYGIQVTGYGGRTFYINITGQGDANAGVAAVSSLTLMEIAA